MTTSISAAERHSGFTGYSVTIKLGGAHGTLHCEECDALRWPNSKLCPNCWAKAHPDQGTRNKRGVVIQQRLPRDVWQAANFAGSLIRKGKHPNEAARIAAGYYSVEAAQVRSAVSQRSGRSRQGVKRSARSDANKE